jgi:C4-dicarboxylate-specific signal transduction histidine kinase
LDRKHVQLVQSGKLATLGEMATGIAHELNQPLSGIRTRAQFVIKLLERGVLKPEKVDIKQREIISLIDRISRIISHMRIFARQDQQHFQPFKLTQSLDGALSLIGEQLRIHAIQLVRKIPDDIPSVFGESLQIEQVLLNLLSNARDALDMRSDMETDRGLETEFHKQITISVEKADHYEVLLKISDNGIGMNEETRAKIFEPFFTTKAVGRGTGLGLSISYGILTDHNGRFDVESELGKGTTFLIYLPIWRGENEAGQVVAKKPAKPQLETEAPTP